MSAPLLPDRQYSCMAVAETRRQCGTIAHSDQAFQPIGGSMTRGPSVWLPAALLGAALLAGCGSGTSTTTNSQSSPTPAATGQAGATTATTSTGGATTPKVAGNPATIQAAVAACKHEIQALATMPASSKAKLEAVCEKVARGDTSSVHQAGREVCEEVINSSPLPSGAAKDKALATCRGK
jgi:hypothetical protein